MTRYVVSYGKKTMFEERKSFKTKTEAIQRLRRIKRNPKIAAKFPNARVVRVTKGRLK